MKKSYRLKDLGCASCAAKMERAIRKLDGVADVQIDFMTQRLILEVSGEDLTEILEKAQKCIARIEPDCRIVGV